MKKGQVTVFIIIGIVLMSISVMLYFLITELTIIPKVESTDFSAIQQYIQTCFENQAKVSVEFIAIQGGFYNQPEHYFENEIEGLNVSYLTPIYTLNGQDFSNEVNLRDSLEKALKEKLPRCIDKWPFIEKISADFSKMRLQTKFNEYVTMTVTVPIQVDKLSETKKMDKFVLVVPGKLFEMHYVSKQITMEQTNGSLCMSCGRDIINQSSVSLYINEVERNDTFDINYRLSDEKNGLVYTFSHSYDIKLLDGVVLDEIEDVEIHKGGSQFVQLYYTGLISHFEDNSDFVNIDKNGIMHISSEIIGTEIITITAHAKDETFDQETFMVSIKNE